MKGTRHQEGYLYRKGSLWLLRYYDSEFVADGSVQKSPENQETSNGRTGVSEQNCRSRSRKGVPRSDQPRKEHARNRNDPDSLHRRPLSAVCGSSTSGSAPSMDIETCGGDT